MQKVEQQQRAGEVQEQAQEQPQAGAAGEDASESMIRPHTAHSADLISPKDDFNRR